VPAELHRFWLAYAQKYAPVDLAFACSTKTIEYDLAEVSQALKWPVTLGFNILRWTAAWRDLNNGVGPERLRLKMGLSDKQWSETLAVLRRIAV